MFSRLLKTIQSLLTCTVSMKDLVLVCLLIGAIYTAYPLLTDYQIVRRGSQRPIERGQTIEMASLLMQVRDQLIVLEKASQTRRLDPLFKLTGLEMELKFVAKRMGSTSGSVKLEVIEAGSERSYSQEQIQRIKLNWDTMPPVDHKGKVAPGYDNFPTASHRNQ